MSSLKHLFYSQNSYSSTAQTIIDNMPTATTQQKDAINYYVNYLIDAGIWVKIIALWGIGSTADELKKNCKNIGTFDLIENAGGTYTYSIEGIFIAGNTSSYYDPLLNCLNNIGSNASLIGVIKNLNISGSAPLFGATNGNKLNLLAPYGTTILAENVNKTINPTISTDKNVMVGNIRTSASAVYLYLNDTIIGQNTTAISGSLPNTNLKIGSYTSSFVMSSSTIINLLCVASGFTQNDYLNFRIATMNFLNVYGKVKDYYAFYGDSNTESPSNLAKRFSRQVTDSADKFEINKGHSGWSLQYQSNTSNSGYYNRVNEIKQATSSDKLYVLCWGTNDIGYNCAYANYNSTVFNTQYRLYIDYMLSKGLTASNIIIMSPPYQTQSARNTFWGTNINNIQEVDALVYIAICQQIAIDYGIKYIDLWNLIKPNYTNLLNSDFVHLSQLGHDFVARKILDKILE